MKLLRSACRLLLLLLLAANLAHGFARAEEHHRATHLGNPGTRFAPTIHTEADLRQRYADPVLRLDFIEILRQWGWTGDPADLFAAGLTNPVTEWDIPVGATIPFMSSREDGRPICLRNVTWAGAEPAPAYAFTFVSRGHVWRCITPKPCSNFFVEDLGETVRHELGVDCDAPATNLLGRPLEICVNVHNTGNVTESNLTVSLPVPGAVAITATSDDGAVTNAGVVWQIGTLPSLATKQLCAQLKPAAPGRLTFQPAVVAATVSTPPAPSECGTEVIGIPAILLEKADDPDPVAVGDTTTYTVKVTNQGTADDRNVQAVIEIAPELVPVSTTEGTITNQTVTLPVVPVLAPKAVVSYRVVAKGVKPGDGHTKFTLSSDMLSSPISAEESTTVY